MTAFRIQAKRTLDSGPPPDLRFGEISYSDEDECLHVGRADPTQLPTTFKSNYPDYSLALAEVNTALDALDEQQTSHDTAIADLTQVQDGQGAAIASLQATVATHNDALIAIPDLVNQGLATKANNADLATVAKTGAYADLSGLPALFSGAYADLLGLPALFSGAYADLSGRPALFSGAYADLSGAPTIPKGFNFDQVTEPTSPAVGATWIERSSGGLIVGRWEWLGSVWAALDTTTLSGAVLNAASPSYPTLSFEAPRCLFVQCRVALISAGNPATPFNATNYRELFLARSNTAVAGSVFAFRPMISLAQSAYVSPMNYLNPSGAFFCSGTTVVGSPGTMHAPSVSLVYREVRA